MLTNLATDARKNEKSWVLGFRMHGPVLKSRLFLFHGVSKRIEAEFGFDTDADFINLFKFEQSVNKILIPSGLLTPDSLSFIK